MSTQSNQSPQIAGNDLAHLHYAEDSRSLLTSLHERNVFQQGTSVPKCLMYSAPAVPTTEE